MTRVMAFGSFSILHPGHILYLNEARKLGDELIVVLATDKNIEKEKGIKPVFNSQERLNLIASLSCVDEAVMGYEEDFFRIVHEKSPDILALGYDAQCSESEMYGKLKENGIDARVVKIKASTPHKTSAILDRPLTGKE